MRAGKYVEQLLHAFLLTTYGFLGSAERLVAYGLAAAHIVQEAVFPFTGDEVAAYVALMKERGFPAVHHSPAFKTEYRPAYRVVSLAFLPKGFIAAAKQLDGADPASCGLGSSRSILELAGRLISRPLGGYKEPSC